MRLPKRVKVGGHVYKVMSGTGGHLAALHSESRGTTIPDELSIVVDEQLPASRQRETLLHEVLHACWDATSLRVGETKDGEEVVVTALAPVLLEVLRRNGRLADFLLEQ